MEKTQKYKALDGPIHANRLALQIVRANRLILANRFRVPELNASRRLKNANRRFEAIRANRSLEKSANRGLPLPLGRRVRETKSKKGAPDTENPSCIGSTVLRGGSRPGGRGRS